MKKRICRKSVCLEEAGGGVTVHGPLSGMGCAGYNFGLVLPDRPFEPEKPMMKRSLLSAACLALAFAALPAAAKGDAENGKALFYTCTGCHGIADYKNAYPTYRVPKVGGQNEQYLVSALTSYKKGERPHPTMRAQGEGLSDQDIADLAAYLSSLKPAK